MRDSDAAPIDETRHQLLKTKLGWLLTWPKPDIRKTIGPHDPAPFELYDSRRDELVERCRGELARYSDTQIAILADRQQPDPENLRQVWRSFEHDRIQHLANVRPLWFAGGFGHPEHAADVDYWSKMTHFSIEELACLTVGVDPRHLDSFKLGPSRKPGTAESWPAQDFLQKRVEQLRRQFAIHDYRPQISPESFISWVDKVSFEVEPEFLSLLRKYHQPDPEPAPAAPPAKPDKREVNKIAQLFTAMAIEYYGYSPRAPRGPVPREIAELAASMGMQISEDTIRQYLRRGAEQISEDWKPNKR